MEQSPLWEADSRSGDQQFSRDLYSPKIHCHFGFGTLIAVITKSTVFRDLMPRFRGMKAFFIFSFYFGNQLDSSIHRPTYVDANLQIAPACITPWLPTASIFRVGVSKTSNQQETSAKIVFSVHYNVHKSPPLNYILGPLN
jgi:hypothetical protein